MCNIITHALCSNEEFMGSLCEDIMFGLGHHDLTRLPDHCRLLPSKTIKRKSGRKCVRVKRSDFIRLPKNRTESGIEVTSSLIGPFLGDTAFG